MLLTGEELCACQAALLTFQQAAALTQAAVQMAENARLPPYVLARLDVALLGLYAATDVMEHVQIFGVDPEEDDDDHLG